MQRLFITIFLAFVLNHSASAEANTYPTDEIVRYVVSCMAELGGQNEENLYTCVCRLDHLRADLTYEEYDGGNIMERNKKMPGEKGAFFRDNEEGDRLYEKLLAARENAFAKCPKVVRVTRDTSKQAN